MDCLRVASSDLGALVTILLSLSTTNDSATIQSKKYPTVTKKKNDIIRRAVVSGVVVFGTLVAGPIGFLVGGFVATRICY